MTRTATYVKALSAGAALCIGGPALVMYVTPSEEEIFKRYNPELQARALANRHKREQEFDDFVTQLKEASKSNKSIWLAQQDIDKKRSEENAVRMRAEQETSQTEAARLRAEVRAAADEVPKQAAPSKGWKSWIGL